MTAWEFEADYFTACNCDWGCPCNFNARPSQGECHGWGMFRIDKGHYGPTKLDKTAFASYYHFPGLVEQGAATCCAYIDNRATKAQQQALDAIATGKVGGGIFELFGKTLAKTWLPTQLVPITFDMKEGKGRVRVGEIAEAESELLTYPDGSVIRPYLDLPHGIEFRRALMVNAKSWWWRDRELMARHVNRYGAWSRVKFNQDGIVG